MKVHEIIASAIGSENVGRAFVVLGNGNMATCIHLGRYGTQLCSARHEAAAVAMAEGHYLATGQIGFSSVTQGPGLTQIGTSLTMASRNRVPMVVLTGDVERDNPSHTQALDQRRFIESCEAGYRIVRSARSVLEDVREAFYRARVESRPVILSVDSSLQDLEYEWGGTYQSSLAVLGRRQVVGPDELLLDELAESLKTARRPVILVGRGAITADAGEEIRRLAARVGAVIFTTLPAKGWLDDEPCMLGIAGSFVSAVGAKACGDADLVLAVGASLNRYTLEGGLQFPNAAIWSVNTVGHSQIGDVPPDRQVIGDGRRGVHELEARLAAQGHTAQGFRTDQFLREIADERVRGRSYLVPADLGKTLDPREVVAAVDALLPEDSYVVIGQGHYWAFPIAYMRGPGGNRFVVAGEMGAVGQGLATAVGFALGLPGKTVILFEGDGSLMMHVQELDTAVRYGARLLLVVMNDEAFGSELHALRAKNLDPSESLIPSPRFDRVAEAFGWIGRYATARADLDRSVKEFLEDQRPYLVDVRISRDVVSDPIRRLRFGEDVRAPLL
jgi:acetolactate synthase I/II/III large subunit